MSANPVQGNYDIERATLTPEETRRVIGWGRSKMYAELQSGSFWPARKVGGTYVISRELLYRWINGEPNPIVNALED